MSSIILEADPAASSSAEPAASPMASHHFWSSQPHPEDGPAPLADISPNVPTVSAIGAKIAEEISRMVGT